MNDDRRRRLRGGSGFGSAARRGRVGEPNVLSNAATPNVLSNMAPPPTLIAPGLAAPTVQTRSGPDPGPANPSGEGWLGSGRTATKPRGRLSFSTLLFLGFLALTAVRAIGEFVDDQSSAPVPTTAPGPGGVPPGLVTFGTGAAGDCTVNGSAVTFSPGQDVWWSAEMATQQGADADAIVIYFVDGAEVSREYIPADPDFGEWSVLCGNQPIEQHGEGRYRLEVWDGDLLALQSVGEYVVTR